MTVSEDLRHLARALRQMGHTEASAHLTAITVEVQRMEDALNRITQAAAEDERRVVPIRGVRTTINRG